MGTPARALPANKRGKQDAHSAAIPNRDHPMTRPRSPRAATGMLSVQCAFPACLARPRADKRKAGGSSFPAGPRIIGPLALGAHRGFPPLASRQNSLLCWGRLCKSSVCGTGSKSGPRPTQVGRKSRGGPRRGCRKRCLSWLVRQTAGAMRERRRGPGRRRAALQTAALGRRIQPNPVRGRAASTFLRNLRLLQ